MMAGNLYFEELGDDFDRFMSDYDVERRIELISRFMPDDSDQRSCFEVGCGTGRISSWLAPRTKSLTVSDISAKLAAETAKRLNVDGVQGDACSLNIPDATYDLVVSSECIEHTPDPIAALREMFRITRPGGVVIVTTPNKLWFPLIWFSAKTGIRRFNGYENWIWPGEAARTFKQSGAATVSLSGCHLAPWQLPFAKSVLPLFDRAGKVLYPFMINFCVCAELDN